MLMTLKIASAERVAARYRVAEMEREAALKEWLKWIAQPLKVIYDHHREFVQGPVDDAVDNIIRDLAPVFVKRLGEIEVDADVDEFTEGAVAGKWHADRGEFSDESRYQREGEDFLEGYRWGFDNAADWSGGKLPSGVKTMVVRDAIKTFRGRVTEEVARKVLTNAWKAISPSHTLKAIISMVKKHGWKLGVVFALAEIVEHTLLPAFVIWATGDPKWAILGTLPITEVIYAVVFAVLRRVPANLDKVDPDGHLDWYEAKFGPVRLASASRVMTAYQIRATCHDRLTTTRLSPA